MPSYFERCFVCGNDSVVDCKIVLVLEVLGENMV